MSTLLLAEQSLNGLQLGVMLFLMAAGLTLVFGIMNLVNLAHGSLYMIGAYLAATLVQATGSFALGMLLALVATAAIGVVLELTVLRTLYDRSHLDQVLATFGLILTINELVRIIWGPQAYFMALPDSLNGSVEIVPGAPYPVFRLAIIGVGFLVALGLALLINRTRLGMLIRAGASNRRMVAALGVDIALLYTLIFGLGAALAGLAGMMAGPIFSVEVGMGEPVLILAFVVIVIGGIGSIKGALVGSVLVGVTDTLGRFLLPRFFALFMEPSDAASIGAAIASMLIYVVMAFILAVRPQGLFAANA